MHGGSAVGRACRRLRGRGGSALVETLVALAILSVAMGALAQFTFVSLTRSAMAQSRARGALVAQELIEDVIAHSADLAAWEQGVRERYQWDGTEGVEMYRFPEPERAGYRWKWETNGVAQGMGLRQVTVRVRWRPLGGRSAWDTYELTTLVAVPTGQAGEGR